MCKAYVIWRFWGIAVLLPRQSYGTTCMIVVRTSKPGFHLPEAENILADSYLE